MKPLLAMFRWLSRPLQDTPKSKFACKSNNVFCCRSDIFAVWFQRDGVPDDYCKHNPEHRQIYKFVRTLFNAAQLTAECAIITLVYLER